MYNHEEVLKYLTAQDKEELALWEGLIEHKGYGLLLKVLKDHYESSLSVIANAASWEAYHYNRGARDAIEVVLNLEQALEFTVEQKLAAAKAGESEDFVQEATEEYL